MDRKAVEEGHFSKERGGASAGRTAAVALRVNRHIPMRVGETLKVRFIGSNDGFIHPFHIHGGPFQVVAIDG